MEKINWRKDPMKYQKFSNMLECWTRAPLKIFIWSGILTMNLKESFYVSSCGLAVRFWFLKREHIYVGTYILLRKHILGFLDPVRFFFVFFRTENKQLFNLPPPTSAYVIYDWSQTKNYLYSLSILCFFNDEWNSYQNTKF